MTYNELINKIEKAKSDYYNTGRSELSDVEYDKLVTQAEKLGYIESVGTIPTINKIKHEHLMLSLDKIHSEDEVAKFVNKRISLFMWKADGLTISCTYQDGMLTRLETRGNGEIGNDILFHAKSFKNLPLHINKPGKYVIDGECVILKEDFESINKTLPETEKYSNARNLAAGSLNLLDNAESSGRCLRFYAWDIIEGGEYDSLYLNLGEASTLGFDVVANILVGNDVDIKGKIEFLRNYAINKGYPIDGIVIKYDSREFGAKLGRTAKFFRNAVAYKFYDNTYPTKLKNVVWQVGKSGQISPVAEFEPVTIDNTKITRASLHNLSIINELGLTNGCTCYVKKANMIVPMIEYADNDGVGEIEIPKYCPICKTPTVIKQENESKVLYCANTLCPGRLLGLWKTFVSKQGMDIRGLSEATLETLLRLGYINNMYVTIYELGMYRSKLLRLDGFGEKSVDKLLAAIEDSKKVDLTHFITAFSIPGIGPAQAKLLAEKFKTFENFVHACDSQYNFTELPGIGETLKYSLIQWWIENHVQMLDVGQVVKFVNNEFMNPPMAMTPIKGMTFVVTGTVEHFKNRGELQKKIESLGGKVAGSVSKNTNYLINNDVESSSKKNLQAKQLNIPIISEMEFLELINKE